MSDFLILFQDIQIGRGPEDSPKPGSSRDDDVQHGDDGSPQLGASRDGENEHDITLSSVVQSTDDFTIRRTNGTRGSSITFEVTLNSNAIWEAPILVEISDTSDRVFSYITDVLRDSSKPDSLFRLTIHQQTLDSVIIVPLMEMKHVSSKVILDRIAAVSQSKRKISVGKSLKIQVQVINRLQGGARLPLLRLQGERNDREGKHSMVVIHNDDYMCLVRAILVSWAFHLKIPNADWSNKFGHIKKRRRGGHS